MKELGERRKKNQFTTASATGPVVFHKLSVACVCCVFCVWCGVCGIHSCQVFVPHVVTMKKLWRRVICRSASSFDVPPTTTNHLTLAEGKSSVITDNIIRMRNNEVEDPSSFRLELQHRRRSKSESYLPTSDDCVDGHTEYGHMLLKTTIYPVFSFLL